MKSKFYLSGAMLLALASCSNDESVLGVGAGEATDMGLVPVTLSMNKTTADVEATRGTGTVGGVNDDENVWRHENIYVLMTTDDVEALNDEDIVTDASGNKTGWGFTSVRGQVLKQQFNNTFFARPKEETRGTGTVWTLDYRIDPNEGNSLKYYPSQGASDFFAYYVDDASTTDAKGNPNLIEDENTNTIAVNFEIDGSQDLMCGKAAYKGEEVIEKGGFSASTARAGHIPSIEMKHQLTRLTFTLKNGNANAANVTVDTVGVISKIKGKMYVAYQNVPAEMVEWANEKDTVFLKKIMDSSHKDYFESSHQNGKCPLDDFSPITMNGTSDKDLDAALFVAPTNGESEEELKMVVKLSNNIIVGVNPTNGENIYDTESHEVPLVLKVAGGFKKATSYHVNVTIYSFEDIVVDAELEKWVEHDEDINVGADNF